MIVIPAIDLREGRCVRLTHGDASKQTVYSDDPVETAMKWREAGCQRLHVIDLDGAFEGTPRNLAWALKIKKATNVMVQMGGGIRTLHAIEAVLNAGIDKVILGTVVFEEAGLAQSAFKQFQNHIMVALDVRDGIVTVRGWKDSSGFPLEEAISVVEKLGGKEVIYTDISRDGTLEGVNLEGVKKVMYMTTMKVYASGGVSTIEDVTRLKEIGSPGCVVGKAIYEGRLNLKEALDATK